MRREGGSDGGAPRGPEPSERRRGPDRQGGASRGSQRLEGGPERGLAGGQCLRPLRHVLRQQLRHEGEEEDAARGRRPLGHGGDGLPALPRAPEGGPGSLQARAERKERSLRAEKEREGEEGSGRAREEPGGGGERGRGGEDGGGGTERGGRGGGGGGGGRRELRPGMGQQRGLLGLGNLCLLRQGGHSPPLTLVLPGKTMLSYGELRVEDASGCHPAHSPGVEEPASGMPGSILTRRSLYTTWASFAVWEGKGGDIWPPKTPFYEACAWR